MTMESRVKFRTPRNISGASHRNRAAVAVKLKPFSLIWVHELALSFQINLGSLGFGEMGLRGTC